jgi:CMP-N-acetylneuraminic acid synthetase
MSTVSLVWYDGFGRHHENVTEVSSTDLTKTYKDENGAIFTIKKTQIVKVNDTLMQPDSALVDEGYDPSVDIDSPDA